MVGGIPYEPSSTRVLIVAHMLSQTLRVEEDVIAELHRGPTHLAQPHAREHRFGLGITQQPVLHKLQACERAKKSDGVKVA